MNRSTHLQRSLFRPVMAVIGIVFSLPMTVVMTTAALLSLVSDTSDEERLAAFVKSAVIAIPLQLTVALYTCATLMNLKGHVHGALCTGAVIGNICTLGVLLRTDVQKWLGQEILLYVTLTLVVNVCILAAMAARARLSHARQKP